MQLSRWTAVLLMCVAALGCGDSTGPVLQVFELTEIDAKPLPVTLGGFDFFQTVVSGKLFLEGSGSGHVLRVTHIKGSVGDSQIHEGDSGQQNDFRIDHGIITVGSFNGCGAFCPNEVGTYSRSMLTLSLGGTQPVYTYRATGGK
jgi:hypothetical protein